MLSISQLIYISNLDPIEVKTTLISNLHKYTLKFNGGYIKLSTLKRKLEVPKQFRLDLLLKDIPEDSYKRIKTDYLLSEGCCLDLLYKVKWLGSVEEYYEVLLLKIKDRSHSINKSKFKRENKI